MANETDLQVQDTEKQEVEQGDAERTRDRKAFVPRVDIYETGNEIVVVADMPGVNESAVDVTLEKGVLSILGYVDPTPPESYELAYVEYDVGDFQRSFRLSDQIDQDKIAATVKDGILRLRLPKVGPAQARKIAVTAG
jgi:HSP20 family molecular chaperone IbpA